MSFGKGLIYSQRFKFGGGMGHMMHKKLLFSSAIYSAVVFLSPRRRLKDRNKQKKIRLASEMTNLKH